MFGMLARLIDVACWAYNFGLLIYLFACYLRARWASRTRRTLSPFYEPALSTLRRLLPTARFGRLRLDLSPLALFFLVVLFRNVVFYVLIGG